MLPICVLVLSLSLVMLDIYSALIIVAAKGLAGRREWGNEWVHLSSLFKWKCCDNSCMMHEQKKKRQTFLTLYMDNSYSIL